MTQTACVGCGNYCPTNSMIFIDNNLVCNNCFTDNTRRCYTCNKHILYSNKFLCSLCETYYFICKITDELYISDYKASICYNTLKELGIKQILSIGTELPEHKTSDFKLKHIKIDDLPSVYIKQYFEEAHNFIDQGRTLVHCYAGISRSATIVISYLMKRYNKTLKFAYDHCKKVRPFISPNKGFMIQLQGYENQLRELNNEENNSATQIQVYKDTPKTYKELAAVNESLKSTTATNTTATTTATNTTATNTTATNTTATTTTTTTTPTDIIDICDNIFTSSINGTDIKLSNVGVNIFEYLYK